MKKRDTETIDLKAPPQAEEKQATPKARNLGGLAMFFNIKERRRQRIEKNLKDFEDWSKKNPLKHGKAPIEDLVYRTKFEEYYNIKRKIQVQKNRSFDLFAL